MHRHVVSIIIASVLAVRAHAEDLNESLWRLAELGFEQTTECVLERGADPNACPPTNDSTLSVAAYNGSAGVVRVLLSRHAPVSLPNIGGQTPLHLAAAGGHAEVVDELLSRTSIIDVPDNDEQTPLHLAIANGRTLVVDILLDGGATPDLINGNGIPPASIAASLEYPRIIDSLFAAGANIDVISRCVGGAIEDLHAVSFKFEAPTSELRAHTQDVPIICGGTPLFYAIRDQAAEAAGRLLELGASPHKRNAYGDTPIFFALRRNRINFLPLLGHYGADPNAHDASGHTPLLVAIRTRSVEAVAGVAAIGADIERPDKSGTRPIHAAAETGSLEVLHRILDLRANVMSRDSDGHTALHVAAANGNTEGTRLLLTSGADVNARGTGGATPLMVAASRHAVGAIQILLGASADVQAKDNRSRGLLWYAVLGGDADIVAQFLRRGAQASEPDQFGVTPWQLALWNERTDIAPLLPPHETVPTVSKKEYLSTWLNDVSLILPRQPQELRTDEIHFEPGVARVPQIDFDDLPAFPWPPPRASAFAEIPARILTRGKDATFESVANRIRRALYLRGYTEPTYYQVQRNGFAIVTPAENFYPDGRIKPPDQRWLLKPIGELPKDPLEYLEQLVGKPRGQYRMIVFIITTDVLRPFAGKEITLAAARNIFNQGAATIAPIGDAPFTAAHTCYALVYEFEQNGYSQPSFVPKSGISGERHLAESRILEELTR